MQSFIYFFMIFAMSLAADVSVYTDYEFFIKYPTVPKVSCFSFGYHRNDLLYMNILFTNIPPSVTGIEVIFSYQYTSNMEGIETVERLKFEISTGNEYYWFRRVLNYTEVKFSLELYKSHSACSAIAVVEGMDVATSNNEITDKAYRDNDICLQATTPCLLLVDLKHECEGDPVVTERNMKTRTANPVTEFESLSNSSFNSNVPTTPQNENIGTTNNNTESSDQQPSVKNVLICVMTSAIVMCVMILVIYFCVKKYCHRNSHPVDSMELNTYATANEVVYADLSLVHGDSRSPRHEEESPYAQIIGVLKPVDGKTKNK